MVGFVRFIILLLHWTVAAAVDVAYASPMATNYAAGDAYAVDVTTAKIFSDILKNQVSAKSAFTSSSPECWMNSINTIHKWVTSSGADNMSDDAQNNHQQYHHDSLGSSFFASMTTDEQEIFALELTHCQLMKANRQLYDSSLVVASHPTTASPMEVQGCAVGMGRPSPYHASSCFPLMSEYAFQLYNTMFLHTREVCASLTEERMMQQKEVITHMLVGASAAVSQQMQNVLGEVTTVAEKLDEQSTMIEEMTTQTYMVFEQLQAEAVLMAEQHKEMTAQSSTVFEQLQVEASSMAEQHKANEQAAAIRLEEMTSQTSTIFEQLQAEAILMAEQQQAAAMTMELMTNQTTTVLERVQDEVTSVIAEQQRAHEHATSMVLEKVQLETATLIAQQAAMFAEQADKIKEQDHVIERMQDLLARANEQMKPLSSIEFIMKTAEDGFAALKVLVNFVITMFITWMITTPTVLRGGRRYIYLLFTLSLLVEIAFMLWISGGDQSVEGAGIEVQLVVRVWTRVSAVLIFVLSPIVSCFSSPVKDVSASSVTTEDLLKIQMHLLAKLNETIPAGTRSTVQIEGPSNAANVSSHSAVTLDEERKKHGMHDNASVSVLNMERRSFQSPLKQIAPVVTPTKERADASENCIAHPNGGNLSAMSYRNGFALEYMLDEGNDGDCSSSGDDSSCNISSNLAISNNKRTVSDIYSSSSDESRYFSAKDEEMSVSSNSIDASPTKKRKGENQCEQLPCPIK